MGQVDKVRDGTGRKNLVMAHTVPPSLAAGEAEIAPAIVIEVVCLLRRCGVYKAQERVQDLGSSPDGSG